MLISQRFRYTAAAGHWRHVTIWTLFQSDEKVAFAVCTTVQLHWGRAVWAWDGNFGCLPSSVKLIFLEILFHQNCRSTEMLTTKNNEWRWWPLHSCLRVGRGTLARRWDCIFCIRNQNVKTFIPGNILSDVQIHFRMFQRKWVVAFAQLSGCFGGVTIFHDAIENLTVDTCVHTWEGFDFSDESN